MKLEFARFCSSVEALSDGIIFLAEVNIFSFWPKTMDYNKAFWLKSRPFFSVLLLHTGRCYEAEICTILLLFRSSFRTTCTYICMCVETCLYMCVRTCI